MSFETLLVIVLAGLGGPLLGVSGRRFVPVVIGEILAGILVGPAVLGAAAVLLPALEETGIAGPEVMTLMAQVTIADLITILSVPIVLQPGRLAHAALGGGLVAVAVLVLLGLARALMSRRWVHHLRGLSKQRHWALDLRLSLLVLFLLAWIAQKGGTSILIAGFGAGVMVALIGGPKRLSTQMRGVAEGFFIPLYFVVLGAQLDLGGLVDHPSLLALAGALVGLNVVIHLVAVLLLRKPPATGLVATAQLGVPAAIASLGLSEHVLSASVATAIVVAALVSLGVCTVGVVKLVRLLSPAPAPAALKARAAS